MRMLPWRPRTFHLLHFLLHYIPGRVYGAQHTHTHTCFSFVSLLLYTTLDCLWNPDGLPENPALRARDADLLPSVIVRRM